MGSTQLRRGGVSTEIYLGREQSLRAQLSYAVRKDVSVVILIGDAELRNGTLQIRDMKARIQSEVQESEALIFVRRLLDLQ